LGSSGKPEEVRPWAAALYKQRADDYRKDSDGIACLPPGPKAGISGLENSFTMEGTGVEFVKDAKGAVTAMIQHWVEGDRYFARRR
jgi:hypothetical protein